MITSRLLSNARAFPSLSPAATAYRYIYRSIHSSSYMNSTQSHPSARSGLPTSQLFTVLGIETSCDDTGVAVVRSDGAILSHVVYSQNKIHGKFGGVVPGLAMEAHQENMKAAVTEALSRAGMRSVAEVDGISVTKGPGLEVCLRVGIREAQELARTHCKPFATVHHLEAHCLVARLAGELTSSKSSECASLDGDGDLVATVPRVQYPFLALLVSGGHTSLLLCRGLGDFTTIGQTLDDALGESFDKAARILGINAGFVNGGPAVESAARGGDPLAYEDVLSVPMRRHRNCDFSYSGLKTSFRMTVLKAREAEGLSVSATNAPTASREEVTGIVTLPEQATRNLCASFQHTAFSHVEDRLFRAMAYVFDAGLPIRTLVVVGGVAANTELRKRLTAVVDRANVELVHHDTECEEEWRLCVPPPNLCTDNGVMAAWAGIEKFQSGVSDEIEGQEPIARWPLGESLLSTLDTDINPFRKRTKK